MTSAIKPKLITIEDYQKEQEEIANAMPDGKSQRAYKVFIKTQVKELQDVRLRLQNSGIHVNALASKIDRFIQQCSVHARGFALLQQSSAERRLVEQTEREIAKEEFIQKSLALAEMTSSAKKQKPQKWYEVLGFSDRDADPRDVMIHQTTDKWRKNVEEIPLGKRYLTCKKTLNHASHELKELKETHDREKMSKTGSSLLMAVDLAERNEFMTRNCSKKDAVEERIYTTERSFDWYVANVTSEKKEACEMAVDEAKEELANSYSSLKFTRLDVESRERLVKITAERLTKEVQKQCPQY